MMVSERPAVPPPAEAQEPPAQEGAPPPETPPLPAPPTAPSTLQPSGFLNGFDLVLVLGTIVLGFAIASFSVRNADFWMHLGTGKLIAEGKYEFGKDPFSYSTEGRKWTNPSWLYDVIVYKLHGVGKDQGQEFGTAVVIFKGVLIAALAGLLLFARRPGQSLWIGAVCVSLALIASAPRLLMDPAIVSMFFLALTVWLLIHAGRFKQGWSLPIGFGAIFAVWSNCDEWFILGPIVLALFLLGESLRQKMQPAEPGEERVPLATLATALAVGIAACMLNPHHVGVWRLPIEMQSSGVSEAIARDASFAPLFRSAFEKNGLDLDVGQGGNPVNGIAFLTLVGLNVLALILGRKRLSWGLLLVNSGLLALAIVRQRAIPFYALVAAPITALQFGYVFVGLKDKTYSRSTLQALSGTRVAIRLFLLLCGLLALTATWPGWLHPLAQHRRLAWTIVPDPTLERPAKLLKQWRSDERIPVEARSLILHPDLAAYCAYYAPAEKTYFDGRIGLHGPEAENYFKVRQLMMARRPGEPRPPEFNMDEFLTEQRIAFVVVVGTDRPEGLNSFLKFSTRESVEEGKPPQRLWEMWDIAGKASIFGWARVPASVLPPNKFRAMRFDPMPQAFGRDVVPVPDAEVPLPPPTAQQTFTDRLVKHFLEVPPEPAAGTEEALLLAQHQQVVLERFERKNAQHKFALMVVFGVSMPDYLLGAVGALANRQIDTMISLTQPRPAEFNATALLAVRDARRGIAASPNNADGYFALAEVYRSPALQGLADETRDLVMGASLGRYYARLSPEQQAIPTEMYAQQAAHTLFFWNLRHQRIDLANEFLRRWLMGVRSGPQPPRFSEIQFVGQLLTESNGGRAPRLTTEAEVAEAFKAMEQHARRLDQAVREAENLWLNNTAKMPSQRQRALKAQQDGLYRKALQELNAIDTGPGSKLKHEEIYAVLFARIQINLFVGQAEEADEIIRMIDDGLQKQQQDRQRTDFDDPRFRGERSDFYRLKRDVMLVLGRFSEVLKVISLEGAELQANLDRMSQSSQPMKIHGKDGSIGLREIVVLGIAKTLSNRPGATFAALTGQPYLVVEGRLVDPFEPIFDQLVYRQYLIMVPGAYPQLVPGAYPQTIRGLEDVHFRMGMTYLEQGENAKAATQFREVTRSATPQSATQTQRSARFMLDLLKAR